jgi:hypothetical protein
LEITTIQKLKKMAAGLEVWSFWTFSHWAGEAAMSSRKTTSPEQDGEWVLYDQEDDHQGSERVTITETTIHGSPGEADPLGMSYLDISSTKLKIGYQFDEFVHEEDHDRSLSHVDSSAATQAPLSIDVCEPPIELDSFSPPLTSDYSSPNPRKNILETEEEEGEPSPDQRPQVEDLEWWRRINGYGLAAFVVGTASIVAYSVARRR